MSLLSSPGWMKGESYTQSKCLCCAKVNARNEQQKTFNNLIDTASDKFTFKIATFKEVLTHSKWLLQVQRSTYNRAQECRAAFLTHKWWRTTHLHTSNFLPSIFKEGDGCQKEAVLQKRAESQRVARTDYLTTVAILPGGGESFLMVAGGQTALLPRWSLFT